MSQTGKVQCRYKLSSGEKIDFIDYDFKLVQSGATTENNMLTRLVKWFQSTFTTAKMHWLHYMYIYIPTQTSCVVVVCYKYRHGLAVLLLLLEIPTRSSCVVIIVCYKYRSRLLVLLLFVRNTDTDFLCCCYLLEIPT